MGIVDCDLRLLLSQVSKEKHILLFSFVYILLAELEDNDLYRASVTYSHFVLHILNLPGPSLSLCASASSHFDSLLARVYC